MSFRAITISGEVASGKSSVAGALLSLLPGWTRINTGQRFRDFCSSKNMSIQQVSELADEIHIEFDVYQKTLLRQEKNVIVEGRLAGWLAKDIVDVYKVFCNVDLETRVARYMERDKTSRERAVADIQYRDAKDVEKFYKIYGVADYRNTIYYNLKLNTSILSPLDLAKIIIKNADL